MTIYPVKFQTYYFFPNNSNKWSCLNNIYKYISNKYVVLNVKKEELEMLLQKTAACSYGQVRPQKAYPWVRPLIGNQPINKQSDKIPPLMLTSHIIHLLYYFASHVNEGPYLKLLNLRLSPNPEECTQTSPLPHGWRQRGCFLVIL